MLDDPIDTSIEPYPCPLIVALAPVAFGGVLGVQFLPEHGVAVHIEIRGVGGLHLSDNFLWGRPGLIGPLHDDLPDLPGFGATRWNN
ncbi:hypothetical protein [Pseudooceanicola nanhaiensis]|uniref:hypothetical protein n=1 Tax=Pseudooceanicola nanhaiensis TaxID=375761 RepID=UPI001E5A809C|nr:hypothetical protein [Pseudooceanicola nanhaiensis]